MVQTGIKRQNAWTKVQEARQKSWAGKPAKQGRNLDRDEARQAGLMSRKPKRKGFKDFLLPLMFAKRTMKYESDKSII